MKKNDATHRALVRGYSFEEDSHGKVFVKEIPKVLRRHNPFFCKRGHYVSPEAKKCISKSCLSEYDYEIQLKMLGRSTWRVIRHPLSRNVWIEKGQQECGVGWVMLSVIFWKEDYDSEDYNASDPSDPCHFYECLTYKKAILDIHRIYADRISTSALLLPAAEKSKEWRGWRNISLRLYILNNSTIEGWRAYFWRFDR